MLNHKNYFKNLLNKIKIDIKILSVTLNAYFLNTFIYFVWLEV